MSTPPTEFDLAMMRRAISLGMRARGTAEPNPTVGCVIVKDGRVIGEGYTQPFGGAHAEPTALANCTESPAGSTAYVTLEPCCHTNKKTPPCTPQVIAAGIKRVVVGCLDPNPAVNGQGIAQLRAAGIEVVAPVLEAEAKQLHAPFIAHVNLKRPYVTLKWAETTDGKVAGRGGTRLQISNGFSSRQVHELRARSDAILVGINTVLADDPLLTARDVPAVRPLLRAIMDSDLRLPITSKLVTSALTIPVIDYTSDYGVQEEENRLDDLRAAGVTVVPLSVSTDMSRPMLAEAVADLGGRRVTHLLVEPGPTLATSFLVDDLADRVWVFRSQTSLNDQSAPTAAAIPVHFIETGKIRLHGDMLHEYLNMRSSAFFAPVESADFVRVRQSVQNGRD